MLAEIFRAGINAVPKGQAEAAYAIGMRKTQVMNIVLLPQAVKIMLPSIISQCVVALKDTSLGFAIGAPGLTYVGKPIYTEFQNQVQAAIVVTAIYVVVNLLLTALATWVQKKYVGEKTVRAALQTTARPSTLDAPVDGSPRPFVSAPDVAGLTSPCRDHERPPPRPPRPAHRRRTALATTADLTTFEPADGRRPERSKVFKGSRRRLHRPGRLALPPFVVPQRGARKSTVLCSYPPPSRRPARSSWT